MFFVSFISFDFYVLNIFLLHISVFYIFATSEFDDIEKPDIPRAERLLQFDDFKPDTFLESAHSEMKFGVSSTQCGMLCSSSYHCRCRRLPPVTEITTLHRQENKIQHRVHYQYTEYRLWTLKTSFI